LEARVQTYPRFTLVSIRAFLPSEKDPRYVNIGLDLSGIKITSAVVLSGTEVNGPIHLSNEDIEGSLYLNGATFNACVDISNTRIAKAVLVGTRHMNGKTFDRHWARSSSFSLANSSVGAVETPYDQTSWAPELNLANFTFAGFLGWDTPSDASPARKELELSEWFCSGSDGQIDPAQPL
jgi:hypothetical protein